jgi:hypothetical protein
MLKSSQGFLSRPMTPETDEDNDEMTMVPLDEEPTDEEPTDEEPTDEAPTDEAPTDEAPTDEAPTDEAPTDEAPTDEAPVMWSMDDLMAIKTPAGYKSISGLTPMLSLDGLYSATTRLVADIEKMEMHVPLIADPVEKGINPYMEPPAPVVQPPAPAMVVASDAPFLTRKMEEDLLATRTDKEFIERIQPNVLAYMEDKTLIRLTKHLLDKEHRPNVKRKPFSTRAIMEARKRYRNRGSAKASKKKAKTKTDAIRLAFREIHLEIISNPNILDHFSETTRNLIHLAM